MFRSLLLIVFALASQSAIAADTPWIEESNQNAEVLLEVLARYQPEAAADLGVQGYDEAVMDLKPGVVQRQDRDLQTAIENLEQRRSKATDKRVQQDLDILIDAARDQRQTLALTEKHLLPFFDLTQSIFGGFQNILDARVAKDRHAAALVRLRRYVGAEKGYEPIAKLARDRYEEAAQNTALLGPWNKEAQQYLDNQARYLDGIEDLLKQSALKGWQKDLRTLRKQLDEYAAWVRSSVLPRARATNQLPAEIYADNLKSFGVEMQPQELMERAQASYMQTREELQSLSRQVAAQRKWSSNDYREVLRELKKERIDQSNLMPFYRNRLSQLEDIVRKERIVTLPERDAVIRLATEAESAASPAPHIDPPRLVGNTGEPAEFVLPLANPNAAPGTVMDDFIFDAISWTLTAHEARPGHELQFAAMLERGVSTARVVFAFNSANIEGWALYAEAVMKKHLPLEGQIGSLQARLMREARAFLDPMLNLGTIQPDAAKQFLMEQVVLSEPMAQQEVDRYTFRAPGQATAYFYGYTKLNALRTQVELAMGERFDQQSYHDFIVNQGLLPFEVLEKVVKEEFVTK
jgi:uncharacterized protein (DUF885 family)